MSIRRLLILSLVAINLLTMLGLLVYLSREDSTARRILEERERLAKLTREHLLRGPLDDAGEALLDDFELQIAATIERTLSAHRQLDEQAMSLQLMLAVRKLPILSSRPFTNLVESAVLLRMPPYSVEGELNPAESFPRFYNLSGQLLFSEPIAEQLEPRAFVRNALKAGERYVQGLRLVGPLRAQGRDWGGYYLRLRPPTLGKLGRTYTGVKFIWVLVLVAPAILLGPMILWGVLSRRVVEPLEDIGRVAETVAHGDYSPRLQTGNRSDEVASTMRLLNTMLDLVQSYRDNLEERVDQKTAELEQRHRELQLGQRLAATGTLAAGIAHEINNPLGGMLNAARRLRKKDVDPERRERYLEVLEENIERIGAIVRRVLEVAPRQALPSPVALADVVRRAIELVRHRARTKDVQLEVAIPDNLDPVFGEANELGQVALNLLINAVDASAPGSEVRVAVSTLEDGRQELVVEDQGEGMDETTQQQAFDLFFTTKGVEGTGLGLALVHGIVHGHGGTIDIDSEVGRGTRMVIRLPAAPERDQA